MNSVKNSDFARQPSDAPAPSRLTGARGHAAGHLRRQGAIERTAQNTAPFLHAHGGLPHAEAARGAARSGIAAERQDGDNTIQCDPGAKLRSADAGLLPVHQLVGDGKSAGRAAWPLRATRRRACFLSLILWLQNPAMPTPAGSLAIARASTCSTKHHRCRVIYHCKFACVGRRGRLPRVTRKSGQAYVTRDDCTL